MQTVSNEYAESMKSPLRERGYIQVDTIVSNSTAQNNATVSGNTLASFSQTDKVVTEPTRARYTYTALEPNLIPVDGTFYFPPESGSTQKGVDTGLTAANVDTATTINISFGGKVITNVKGFQIDFGKYYATNASITFSYTPSGDEAAYLKTITLTNGSSEIWKVTADIEKFDSVSITVNSLCETGHRVRINSIVFGFIQVFNNDTITNATLSASVSPVSEELPQIDFSMTVSDTEGLFNPESEFNLCDILGEAMRSTIKYGYQLPNGTIEWVTPYTLYLNSWSYKDGEATLNFVDALRLLSVNVNESTYKELSTSSDSYINLWSTALLIMSSCDWSEDTDLQNEIRFSSETLKKYFIGKNYAFSGSLKENLQKIANAAHCMLFVTRDDIIVSAPITDTTSVITLDKDTLLTKPVANISNFIKNVTVDYRYWVYKTSERNREVYSKQLELNDIGTLTVNFDDYQTNTTVKIGDTVITTDDTAHNMSNNGWTLQIDILNTDVGKTLTVTGWAATYEEKSYILPVNQNGDILEWSNPIVSDTDVEAFAQWLRKWKHGYTYTYNYRGNPELDCGDIITQQITDTHSITGIIESLTLSFNGAFSGTLTIREF